MTKTEKVIGTMTGLAFVAALGAYFLYGKRGARNRRKISGWMFRLKGEVLDRLENIQELSEGEYYRIVDEISSRYARLEKVGAEELKEMTEELKGSWERLNREMMRPGVRKVEGKKTSKGA
ncbi:MAG: hypothetical protein COT17_06845 [Elusimicrobia bacterium CG08_land_8_20_14_0_20_51_18]|nr:MAG: hypothetical protein COT17_06845 [Elusimicrobia bacterium CG08_land_8_20_14_0_20_51_18]